jgi:uncharacterized repeat protein (TIGR03803 family)
LLDALRCENPANILRSQSSNLYGTTIQGGTYGDGNIFSVPITGTSTTVLTSFSTVSGAYPYASLTPSGNSFYGTYNGGVSGYGTVFLGLARRPRAIRVHA